MTIKAEIYAPSPKVFREGAKNSPRGGRGQNMANTKCANS